VQFDGEKPDKFTRVACACNDDKVIFESPPNWTIRSLIFGQPLVTCPIKGDVKKKKLPLGSMPIFFSRHSARPIEAPLREWSCSGAEVVIRLRIRSGETLLPRGSIFATVTAPFVS